MASRVSKSARQEWDEVDFDAQSPSPRNNKAAQSHSKSHGGRSLVSPRKVIQQPARIISSSESSESLDSSDENQTQECIVLEASAPVIQKRPESITTAASRYNKILSPHPQRPSKTIIEESDEGDQSSSSTSIEESDSDDSSLTGTPASKRTTGFSKTIYKPQLQLPDDSDTEAAVIRRKQRRELRNNVEAAPIKSPTRNMTRPVPSNPLTSNTMKTISNAQSLSMIPTVEISQGEMDTIQYPDLPSAKSTHVQIPVSSSTNQSQGLTQIPQTNFHIQQTQYSTAAGESPSKNLLTLMTTSQSASSSGLEQPGLTHGTVDSMDDSLMRTTQASSSQALSSSRKRVRSPSGSIVMPGSSPPKKSRISSRASTPRQRQGVSTEIRTFPSPRASTTGKPTNLEPAHRSVPTTPFNDIARTKKLSQSTHNTPIISVIPPNSGARLPLEALSFDHVIPQISASQPNPTRPRIRQEMPKPLATVADNEGIAVEAAETSDSSSEAASVLHKVDLQVFKRILDFRGVDYCEAVKFNPVYSGLQKLFIDFEIEHRKYLGGMDHLFTLCVWLMNNEDKIEDEYWDDFILQHHEGEYAAYVNRCLMKFKEPGTWDAWYQQAKKRRLPRNIISSRRIYRILRGEEAQKLSEERKAIPELWIRLYKASHRKLLKS